VAQPGRDVDARRGGGLLDPRVEVGIDMEIEVADGDILTIITSNQTKLRIRLFGIDAPETPKGTKYPGQPYGTEAEAYLKQLVEGNHVKVEIYQADRYKRLLSTIFLEGQNINLAMIEAGLAEAYRGPDTGNPYRPHYEAAEEAACVAKKGMWVLGSRYESPRDYRYRVGISKDNARGKGHATRVQRPAVGCVGRLGSAEAVHGKPAEGI
jgi:micrococcal nuclease